MTPLCFSPLLLVGVLTGIQTSWHHQTPLQGEIMEIMTCDKGVGMVATLAPSVGLYGLGIQYGLHYHLTEEVQLGVIPQIGLSTDAHGYKELPMQSQFEVGGEIMAGYKQVRLSLKYWHLSNGGLHSTQSAPNKGLDMVSIMWGWRFE